MVHDIFMAALLSSFWQQLIQDIHWVNANKRSYTHSLIHSLAIILILILILMFAHALTTLSRICQQHKCNSINIMLIKKFASLVRLSVAKMSIEHAHSFSRAKHMCGRSLSVWFSMVWVSDGGKRKMEWVKKTHRFFDGNLIIAHNECRKVIELFIVCARLCWCIGWVGGHCAFMA